MAHVSRLESLRAVPHILPGGRWAACEGRFEFSKAYKRTTTVEAKNSFNIMVQHHVHICIDAYTFSLTYMNK